jgi:hypothetical protein
MFKTPLLLPLPNRDYVWLGNEHAVLLASPSLFMRERDTLHLDKRQCVSRNQSDVRRCCAIGASGTQAGLYTYLSPTKAQRPVLLATWQ